MAACVVLAAGGRPPRRGASATVTSPSDPSVVARRWPGQFRHATRAARITSRDRKGGRRCGYSWPARPAP
jgi:hypothetical protein